MKTTNTTGSDAIIRYRSAPEPGFLIHHKLTKLFVVICIFTLFSTVCAARDKIIVIPKDRIVVYPFECEFDKELGEQAALLFQSRLIDSLEGSVCYECLDNLNNKIFTDVCEDLLDRFNKREERDKAQAECAKKLKAKYYVAGRIEKRNDDYMITATVSRSNRRALVSKDTITNYSEDIPGDTKKLAIRTGRSLKVHCFFGIYLPIIIVCIILIIALGAYLYYREIMVNRNFKNLKNLQSYIEEKHPGIREESELRRTLNGMKYQDKKTKRKKIKKARKKIMDEVNRKAREEPDEEKKKRLSSLLEDINKSLL